MFSFKYRPNDYANAREVICSNEFARLGYSSAYYQYDVTSNRDNAMGHNMQFETYTLWSYETPIMIVRVATNQTDMRMSVSVTVNENSWNISRTTIKHVSHFLQWITFHYTFGCGLSYQNLKRVMRSNRMHFFYDAYEWIECHNPMFRLDVLVSYRRVNSAKMNELLKSYGCVRPLVRTLS